MKISLEKILTSNSITELQHNLTNSGCDRCALCMKSKCIAPYRGNFQSKFVIVGEALGKEDEEKRSPFTGPAGRLMDKAFIGAGMDTNQDFLVTNVCVCRPTSEPGSGKQNYTPGKTERDACKVYLAKTLELTQPKLIIAVGKVAANVLLDNNAPISKIAGTVVRDKGREIYCMFHPAFVLHSQNDIHKYIQARAAYWNNVVTLKEEIARRR